MLEKTKVKGKETSELLEEEACTIVWFRRDLRLEDNPALSAVARAGPILPVFIWSPVEEGQFHLGRVSRWWLKQSLIQLDISLKSLGVGLVQRGLQVQSFNGDLLYEPWEVFDEAGKPFTTFEGDWQKCLAMLFEPDSPLLPPRRLTTAAVHSASCTAEELGLEDDTEKDSNALLARAWAPGWSNADKVLEVQTTTNNFSEGALAGTGGCNTV